MASQATRFPKKLAKKIPLELIQKGVYTINCGTDKIRYKPEQRLAGLTEEQIRAYLEQIQGSKNS